MSVWQEIKDKLSIEEVLSDYVTVKPKGVNYTCLCPFHKEKSPSLIISTEKKIWHCFGCGEGGDIFAFVTRIENIDKSEALQKLAKKASVDLNKYSKVSETEHTQRGDDNLISISKKKYMLLDWLAEIYHKNLLNAIDTNNEEITQYCLKRGLTREMIIKFKLGLATNSSILTVLAQKDPEKFALFKELGLVLD
jgi:DNA primase